MYIVTALPAAAVATLVARHGIYYAARHPIERRGGIAVVGRYRTRREAHEAADCVRVWATAASVRLSGGRVVNDGCPSVVQIR